jgi:uncharacterized protein YjbI with pentapeptide repeats
VTTFGFWGGFLRLGSGLRAHRVLSGRRQNGAAVSHVFPWLGRAAVLGAVGGFGLECYLAMASGAAPAWVLLRSCLGALAGAALGALIGLTHAVEPRRLARSNAPNAPESLWDPWLDRAGAVETEAEATLPTEPQPEIVADRAPVRPRVFTPASGDALPLEDELWPFLRDRLRGAIRLTGGSGYGKTTALRHLAAVLPRHANVSFLDCPSSDTLAECAARGLVICVSESPVHVKEFAVYKVAPWGFDEAVEYLLGVEPERRGSVLSRLKAAPDQARLGGTPELWRIALDHMTADESIRSVRDALLSELNRQLPTHPQRAIAVEFAARPLQILGPYGPRAASPADLQSELPRIVRHRTVQHLLIASKLADDLIDADTPALLTATLSKEIIADAAALLADERRTAATEHLSAILTRKRKAPQPMAASLLLALDRNWRPVGERPPRLSNAYLSEARWARIDLSQANLTGAELIHADLSESQLRGAVLVRANLRGAVLRAATLERAQCADAKLEKANLSLARADHVHFGGATLIAANLSGASLREADFSGADVRSANFAQAQLWRAVFRGAKVRDASFRNAILEEAVLRELDLRTCNLDGARLGGADLRNCNLEGMRVRNGDFEDAALQDALMTGSVLRKANFVGANLRNAKLAEIDWEDAYLTAADLRGASFHMGSSRNGLVFSPIACEGSRTHYYTNDEDELSFKTPEEIRKASLRGADLTKTEIDGVDFYLVDLRGARFDRDQAAHLRRTGAILSRP